MEAEEVLKVPTRLAVEAAGQMVPNPSVQEHSVRLEQLLKEWQCHWQVVTEVEAEELSEQAREEAFRRSVIAIETARARRPRSYQRTGRVS